MVYYCTIEREGDEYIAQFPDMPNIVTCGFTNEEALVMAKEALDGCLEADISQGNIIPEPTYKDGYPVMVASHISEDREFIKSRMETAHGKKRTA